ncbi:hypothetical protein GCM10022381_26000 [Leifsonia kafniensis]|uniref:Uncharacterized protein n=1 Tax=Leifsonia kafniensis TaxID=475957 RepID=A0ABP7KQ36_9MICO
MHCSFAEMLDGSNVENTLGAVPADDEEVRNVGEGCELAPEIYLKWLPANCSDIAVEVQNFQRYLLESGLELDMLGRT